MTTTAYYESNAIYDLLQKEHLIPPFFFAGPHIWHLVYGDAESLPIILLLVTAGRATNLTVAPTPVEQRSLSVLSVLATRSDLPLFHLRFGFDIHEVYSVGWRPQSAGEFQIMPLDQLAETYSGLGLPVRRGTTAKAVNDKPSSAYHNWQRGTLGSNVTVTDIDLWKLDRNRTPLAAFELKRSYKQVEKWTPYRRDYPNFRLLSNALNAARIPFYIAYNRRTKSPWNDDPSKIALFMVNFAKQPPIGPRDIVDFTEFTSRDYS